MYFDISVSLCNVFLNYMKKQRRDEPFSEKHSSPTAEVSMETESKKLGPALFFCVDGELLFHGCSLDNGEPYGDFLNYPYSHFKIWEKYYECIFYVDFDYYPRGRVVYRKTDDTYLIYYDKCMEPFIGTVLKKYAGKKIEIGYDEHYQCNLCNEDYVF